MPSLSRGHLLICLPPSPVFRNSLIPCGFSLCCLFRDALFLSFATTSSDAVLANRVHPHHRLPNQSAIHIPTNTTKRPFLFLILFFQIIGTSLYRMPQLCSNLRSFL